MKLAVIVTTYNRPDALAAVLEGYAAQDTHAFELVVADDGSGDDTRRLIAEHGRRAPFPLRHV
jgi:glycosyltransferase involved in cell wall biosynthesis